MSVSHYIALRDQLTSDIQDATVLGPVAPVHFGAPRREILAFPHAVISTTRTRRSENDGIRNIGEIYEFDIALKLPVPDPYPEGGYETTLMAVADALILLLIPASTSSVPAQSDPFAGVTNMRYVDEVKSMDSEDGDGYIEVRLKFVVIATVYQ